MTPDNNTTTKRDRLVESLLFFVAVLLLGFVFGLHDGCVPQ